MKRPIPVRNSNETLRIPRVVQRQLACIPMSKRVRRRVTSARARRNASDVTVRRVGSDRRPSRSRHHAGVLLNQSERSVSVIRAPTCRQVDSSPPLRTQKYTHRSIRDGTAIGRLKNSHGDVTNVTREARSRL